MYRTEENGEENGNRLFPRSAVRRVKGWTRQFVLNHGGRTRCDSQPARRMGGGKQTERERERERERGVSVVDKG